MIRRLSPAKLWTLMLASVFIHQGPFAAAAGEKSVPIPAASVLAAPFNTALPTVPAITALGAAKPVAAAVAGAPQAASLANVATSIAPQIDVIAAPSAGAADSAEAAQNIQALLQGGKAAQGTGIAADLGVKDGTRAALAPAGVAQPQKQSDVPTAPKTNTKPQVTLVESRVSYEVRRFILAQADKGYGIRYSLPQAGPRLSAELRKELAYKDNVLSDIDDTLAPYSTVLPQSMVDRIVAIRRAGKIFVVITDRPDTVPPGDTSGQIGAFETMASIPPENCDGIILVTHGGGRFYEYKQGQPQKFHEEPVFEPEERRKILDAASVVKARLKDFGAEIKFDPAEDPFRYSMVFKMGPSKEQVLAIAQIMEDQLKERGLPYHVEGRYIEGKESYFTFSRGKIDKTLAVKKIKEILKLDEKKTVEFGDHLYKAVPLPVLSTWRSRLAARLAAWASGQPREKNGGNETDFKMKLGMPGATAISVGGTANPSYSDVFVQYEEGPDGTGLAFDAIASQPAGKQSPGKKTGDVVAILLLVGLSLLVLYALFSAFAAIMSAYPAPMDMPTGGLPPDAKHFPF